jgi:hypothetical protein
MKKILTAAAALLLSVAVFAQSNDAPPPAGNTQMRQRTPMTAGQRAKRETDMINSTTPLGDGYQKVLDVNTQIAKQRESIMGGARRSDLTDDQKTQLKQLNATRDQQLQAAMGADLYGKYKAAEKARRESRGGQQGPPPGGGGDGR